MKSFFLIFLLLYLSLFPSASPVPLVEIVEEELVVHSTLHLPKVEFEPEHKFSHDFPEQITLSPQSRPYPEQRPPDLHPCQLS